jgi:putative molybdenum carrier protein
MRITSGGQSGVDRAALDVAIERNLPWGGWCPKGGWAEDSPEPPGLLARYANLRETPLADPLQRTEWNVRESDAVLVIVDAAGMAASRGTQRGHDWARQYRKPFLTVDAGDPDAPLRAAAWLSEQRKTLGADMTLSIGGPRESEAPGIYAKASSLLAAILDRL